jgi:hypothetical protein
LPTDAEASHPKWWQVGGVSGAMKKRVESNDEKHFTYLFNTRADSCVGAVSCRLLDTKSSANESWWALLPQRWSTNRRNAGAD